MYLSFRLNKLRISALSALALLLVCFIASVPFAGGGTVSEKRSGDDEAVTLCTVMYHGFIEDKSKQNKYMIDPSCLENDLKYLTENGYDTIFVSELIDHFENGAALPEKPVMLTFDDGYYNNYLYAFPLLKKYGCKAVLSPIGRACEKACDEEKQSPIYSQCSFTQLNEMKNSGLVELAYHTYDLHTVSEGIQGVQKKQGESEQQYEERLKADISAFCVLSEREFGVTPLCFTYPFGAKSEHTLDIAKSCGFKAAMDCEGKLSVLKDSDDLFRIHRFLRPNSLSAGEFFSGRLSSAR